MSGRLPQSPSISVLRCSRCRACRPTRAHVHGAGPRSRRFGAHRSETGRVLGIVGLVPSGLLFPLLLGPGTFVLGLLSLPFGAASLSLFLISSQSPALAVLITATGDYRIAGWVRVGSTTLDALVLIGSGYATFFAMWGTRAMLGESPSEPRGDSVILVWIACFTIATALLNARGSSLGKRVLRLRLVSTGGQPPGIRWGAVRAVALWWSLLPLGLGYTWAAGDRERQTWHDKLLGTYVVHALSVDGDLVADCRGCGASVSTFDAFCRSCGRPFRETLPRQ